jgi:hypothetical protein
MRPIIIVLLLFLILGGTFTYLYFKYEPSKPVELINISISADYEHKKITTGYVIETKEGLIEGNTSQSYELEKVPEGETRVYNKNIENQTFYKDVQNLNITRKQRVDLKLVQPTEINVFKKDGKSKVELNLSSIDARQVKLCLNWSFAYIFIRAEGNLTRLNDNCYGYLDLRDSTEQVNITFQEFTIPKESDYINLNLIIDEFEGKLDKKVKIK